VDQARAEARATEAAAEQREAAALALERAELVKQARGCPLHCPGLFLRTVREGDCVEPLCMPCHGMQKGST